MKASRAWIALPLFLYFAACGEEQRPADDPFVDGVGADGGPLTTPPAAPMDMDQRAQMQALQGSGVGGEVTVREMGNQTQVMVRLTGGTANATHPGHIHSGTCQNIGAVVQALEPITADASGAGTMTSTLDLPPATVMNGQHIVVYHGEGGNPVACAAIPEHRM
jgi:hypothetical protein